MARRTFYTRARRGGAGWLTLAVLLACHPDPGGAHREPAPVPVPAPTQPQRTPLDAAVQDHWRRAGVTAADVADDAQYLRRVTLDLAGRIPTADEVADFLALADVDPTPNGAAVRREALVDRLLASDAFAVHWADILTEWLLGDATRLPAPIERGTHAWLTAQLSGPAQWDAMMRAMLTATGRVEAEGPAGFLAVHGRDNRVEALTGTTARVFLGVSIQCAQCHDHPEQHYTQRDFYGFAAYFAQTRARVVRGDGVPPQIEVVDRRRGQMRMPTADDTPPQRSGVVVQPSFLGGPAPVLAGRTRRQALADAVQASPLFAKAAVGRVWTQLFGRGLVEPSDNSDRPPLLDALARQWVADDYDLRALIRAIVLSPAYTRTSAGTVDRQRRTRAFAQFPVRPMTSTQLVRSLLVATGRRDGTVAAREVAVHRIVQQARKAQLVTFGDDEQLSADGFASGVPQALFLLGGPLTVRGAEVRRRGTLRAILAEHATTAARIDAITVTTLGRVATLAERDRFAEHLAATGGTDAAFQDVLHALLLSSEFLTVH